MTESFQLPENLTEACSAYGADEFPAFLETSLYPREVRVTGKRRYKETARMTSDSRIKAATVLDGENLGHKFWGPVHEV